jgi:hypothetical protein
MDEVARSSPKHAEVHKVLFIGRGRRSSDVEGRGEGVINR